MTIDFDKIAARGFKKTELEELRDLGPVTVGCPRAECKENFETELDLEKAVYSGRCPEHGSMNFCVTVSGPAGVKAYPPKEEKRAPEAQ